jgi:hypothetical protein
MKDLLRLRIWPSFSPSRRLSEQEAGHPRALDFGFVLRPHGGRSISFALAELRSVPQAGFQFYGLAAAINEPPNLV